MSVITIAADPDIPWLETLLPADRVSIIRYNPGLPLSEIPALTDALLVRTITQINADALPDPGKISFIGTASAGFDHIDTEYLDHLGIRFVWSPGCNANAVGEYAATAILVWCYRSGIEPSTLSLGIVGCGHTGSALKLIMQRTGIHIHAYDPPREEREPGFTSSTVDEVLNSDILSLHVPLTREGKYPTFHWLNREILTDRNLALVINAARGGVVNETDLLAAQDSGSVRDIVIDVWENEPNIDYKTAKRAFLCSPHIAGYSVQAKFNASLILCKQLSSYFGFELNQTEHPVGGDLQNFSTSTSFDNLLLQMHPLGKYNDAISALIKSGSVPQGQAFLNLRNAFPLRDEYPYLHLDSALSDKFPAIEALRLGAGLKNNQ